MIGFSWEAWHLLWVHWLKDILHGRSGDTWHPLWSREWCCRWDTPQVMNVTSQPKIHCLLSQTTLHEGELRYYQRWQLILRSLWEGHGIHGWKLAESFEKGLPYRFYNCFFTNWWVLCNWHVWSSQRLRHLIHFVGSLSIGPRLSVQLS